LNLEYFIARRLSATKSNKNSISAPIIKIAITAIAIGVMMMIISVATGKGLQDKIREKISAFNGHIIISNYDNNESDVSVEPLAIKQPFYPKFKSVEEVSHIQAVASKGGVIRTVESVEGIVFKGVGKDFRWENLKEYITAGRVPNLKGSLNEEVILSKYLASRLNLYVGDKFNTFFMKDDGNGLPNLRRFKLVGIYNSGFQEFDAMYVLGDIGHVQRMNKWRNGEVGQFEVFAKDFTKITETGEKVYDEVPPTLNVTTIEQKYANIFDWVKLFDFNILVIIIIMVLVATINMVVALLVLILERTQMVGMLKALGATNWSVRKIFLYNAAHIIGRGLLYGNIISIGLLLIQKYFGVIKLPPESYYVTEAPVTLDIISILLINVGTVVTCLILLILPSYIITRISPARAVKFD
jgi:lipoprotein-releasing system permease protein